MRKVFKTLFALIPFKSQIFLNLKKIWVPPETIYRHLYFNGKFCIKLDNEKSFLMYHFGYQLENDIFWNGLFGKWERVSMELWVKLCERADVIFDIGANTGIYSLVAKTKNELANVYAFEPVERVYKKLLKNIALNGYDIQANDFAFSNFSGFAFIYDTNSEHTYSVTVNKNLNAMGLDTRKVEIKVKTIDDFIIEQHIQKIDLIKIDVETHEPEVLEGFLKYIFKFEPTILIEILNDDVGQKVDAIFANSNYLYFNIDENIGVRQVSQIMHSDSYNFLLCNSSVASYLKLAINE